MNLFRIASGLLLSFLLQFLVHARVEYSQLTKRNIGKSTVIGMIVGILETAGIVYLDGARDWNKFKKYYPFITIGAGVGALVGYTFSTVMSPEWDFNVVEKDMAVIKNSKHFAVLGQTPNDTLIDEIKKIEASQSLPLYVAFKKYSDFLKKIENGKQKLENVIKSEVTALHEPSQMLLPELEAMELKLQAALLAIKGEQDFLKQVAEAAFIQACRTIWYY